MSPTAKTTIINDRGLTVTASAPVIVSASRSTDIPAFYADWFFNRLKKGYSVWTNPFNGVASYISYENTRFIVFWSKNPRPLLPHLDYLKERGIGCYIQFTLNDYTAERLEPGVPPLAERIDTFKALVDRLGPGRVVWRFDPLILTDTVTVDSLLDKISRIGDQLEGFTEKLVFSFADIGSYRRVKSNLEKNGIPYREWDEATMDEMARRLSELNTERGWNLRLATCGEKIDIERYGILHNRCVDEDLIIRFGYRDQALMDFLKVKVKASQPSLFDDAIQLADNEIHLDDNSIATKQGQKYRDKGQRSFCNCAVSKDIGQYNTCPHQCEYCYANTSKSAAVANFRRHKLSPASETITGY